MDLSTIARLPIGETPATLFVALELSKATWLVALHSPAADKISLHRLVGGDTQGLLTLITRKRDQAQAALGRPVHVMSCYEAGYDGFWLHRLLCAAGIDNRVLDAASILVDRRSRRAKTDRLDAAALLRTLMALERGEPRVCRVVRVPSPERECRRLWQVIAMIAEVEAEQHQVAAEAATGATQLSRLRGIGLTIASVLTNEVFFRSFQNRREIAGYLGLASSPWNSGSVSRDQGIQRSGNPRARQTAIELAWLWLRHQPESSLARWFQERVGASKGRIRRTMIVALARKLMIALWRYLTQGLMPEGAVIKA